MIHGYPYTDFHEMNLDYIMDLARRTMGLHLVVEGDYLYMRNANGDDISKVTISYAEKALKDVHDNDIDMYFIQATTDATHVILTRGNSQAVALTIPYATKAKEDVNGNDITSYVKGVGVSGNKINVTFGDGTNYQFTVPFATKAENDKNGKDLTTYLANVTVSGDQLVFTDGAGIITANITVPYAVKAENDVDGDAIKTNYGHSLVTGTTTVLLKDKVGGTLSEITVPYAVMALSDDDGNVFKSDYGYHLAVYGSKIGMDAHDGTKLNEITVPFATLATDASNAFETVVLSGDKVKFITYGGTSYEITVPYAVKALKDDLGNTLSETYIANAVNDPLTGKITFYAQDGSVIAEMTPTVDKAVHDSFNNTIADYIKTIVTSPNSDYMTVTHGTGETDSIIIEYSTRAWKDTYGNIIGNVYIKSLAFETVNGISYLVAYNGELSELFRLEVIASKALHDINGKDITSYVAEVSPDGNDNTIVNIIDGDGNTLGTISGTVTTTPTGTVSGTGVTLDVDTDTVAEVTDVGTLPTTSNKTVVTGVSDTTDTVAEVTDAGTLPSLSYDANTEALTFSAGTLPTTSNKTVVTGVSATTDTVAEVTDVGTLPTTSNKTVVTDVDVDTITDPTFTGDATTENVEFN